MAAKWQKWWSYILKSCEKYKKIAERKKKKKSKQTNKQEGQTSQVELELDKTKQME